MKKNELVWRELVDAAVMRGERRWENIDDLAFRSGVATATTAYALRRQIEIGAVRQHHAGFTVVNPEKVLTSLCAARNLRADTRAAVAASRDQLDHIMSAEIGSRIIVGGAAAAVELLGGVNTVSDYSDHLFYCRDEHAEDLIHDLLPAIRFTGPKSRPQCGANVRFLLADARAARTWKRHTSFAQTYADLFATPGWQASEFRFALQMKFLSKRDWDQE